MIFLCKPNQFSKYMFPAEMSNTQWNDLLEHPPVFSDKSKAPLAIYGTMVRDPEPVSETVRRPRCTGANVDYLDCMQLDFDNGFSIREFAEHYAKWRWTLYTSYSYGYKEGDRFRVILPLQSKMPCYVLNNRRVKANLAWHFPHVDPCCFDRGHWQILPCVRSKGAPYQYLRNKGELWGGDDFWKEYECLVKDDEIEFARRAEKAKELTKTVNVEELVSQLEDELNMIPVGAGQRYNRVKHLLAKYVHKGLGEAVLSVPCPWTDKKWQRQWTGLINWAATIT